MPGKVPTNKGDYFIRSILAGSLDGGGAFRAALIGRGARCNLRGRCAGIRGDKLAEQRG
jgi:hypothetical protein